MTLRPGWVSTLAVTFVAATCIRLGFWQLGRYETRSAVAELRTERHALPQATTLTGPLEDVDYRRVRLTGTWTDSYVVTGGIPYSRNGYGVIGKLAVDDGPDVLVLRGWIPVHGWEQHLASPSGTVEVEGVLQSVGAPAGIEPVRLHPDAPPLWPLERETFLGVFSRGVRMPIGDLAQHAGTDVPVYVIEGPELEDLEKRNPHVLPAGGYTTYLKVFHHLEYAVQWFSFAAIAILLWLFYGWRRGRRST